MDRSSEWLKFYDSVVLVANTISKHLADRNKYPKSSTTYRKLTVSARSLLGKLSADVVALSRALDEASNQGALTQPEITRRVAQINKLKTSEKQFEQTLRDGSTSSQSRDGLFGGMASSSANADLDANTVIETSETNVFSSDQLLQHHDRILLEQDRGLDTLTGIVRNQRHVATTIGNEVDRQNVLIDNMGDKMEQVHERLVDGTKKMRLIDRTSGTCGLWMIVILLFVAILVILFIPKP